MRHKIIFLFLMLVIVAGYNLPEIGNEPLNLPAEPNINGVGQSSGFIIAVLLIVILLLTTSLISMRKKLQQ